MSSDTELKAADGSIWSLDNLAVYNQLLGEASGLAEASNILKKWSGEAYAEHNDAKAKILRDLSLAFAQKAGDRKDAAKKRNIEYPECLDSGKRGVAVGK
jgi:hypothetical protein